MPFMFDCSIGVREPLCGLRKVPDFLAQLFKRLVKREFPFILRDASNKNKG